MNWTKRLLSMARRFSSDYAEDLSQAGLLALCRVGFDKPDGYLSTVAFNAMRLEWHRELHRKLGAPLRHVQRNEAVWSRSYDDHDGIDASNPEKRAIENERERLQWRMRGALIRAAGENQLKRRIVFEAILGQARHKDIACRHGVSRQLIGHVANKIKADAAKEFTR